MTTRPLSPAQQNALDWLRRVGKATRSSLRKEGFTTLTMDSLVRRGLVEVENLPHVRMPISIWRPREVTRETPKEHTMTRMTREQARTLSTMGEEVFQVKQQPVKGDQGLLIYSEAGEFLGSMLANGNFFEVLDKEPPS